MKNFFIILFLLDAFLTFSQVKEQQLHEVKVMEEHLVPTEVRSTYILRKDEIRQKNADDLGDLLKHVPGITLKNYGGLGGLKTISSRGINGNHTGVYLDGFLQQNNMIGQIDLSNIHVSNVEEVSFSHHPSESKLPAISSFFYSTNLFVVSSENLFSPRSTQVRYQLKIGSFGQIDHYLSAKYNDSSRYVSVFAKYRQANGDFPYELTNYNTSVKGLRQNNWLKELYAGINCGKWFRNGSSLRCMNLYQNSEKGLPGAVILYGPLNKQQLFNSSLANNLEFLLKNRKNLHGRVYLSNKYDQITYIDSSYLNAQNFLKSDYFTNYLTSGVILRLHIKRFAFSGGLEEEYSMLEGSNYQQTIRRSHSRFILTSNLNLATWQIDLINGFQYVINAALNKRTEKIAYCPTLAVSSKKKIAVLGNILFSLKRTMRMPSFSELYYNQFGNTGLKPEIANQASFGSFYGYEKKKTKWTISYHVFANSVQNKIVATPSKNLFVWSIQNVGKAFIYGLESAINHNYSRRNFSLSTHLNYTFQRALDYEKRSITYLHQLAYIPVHTANFSLTAQYKSFGCTFLSNYVSLRYSLNENIKTNEVPAFVSFDCTTYYRFSIKSNSLELSFTIKNITNASFQYIRNYVMPGRNYLLTLNYALH